MLKYVFIILNVAFVAGFKGLMSDGNTGISQSIPTSALTGTEFIEEVTISKPAGIQGFAKFEQQLPKGFIAIPMEIKGGHFSQNEYEIVKVIWYKVSDLTEFTIKFRIVVDYETSLNEYALSSRFSYLDNNERKSISSTSSKILIEKGADKPKQEELVQLHDTTLHRALTNNIDKMLREAGVACTQVSEMMNKEEAKIDIRVIKGKVSGFAKIEEPVCEGLTAINISNAGGVFSFADNKVKYVWTNLPAGENVSVSFKLVRNKNAGWLDRCTMGGEFVYLEGEKSLKCSFNTVTVDYNKGVTVANVPLPPSANQPAESAAAIVSPPVAISEPPAPVKANTTLSANKTAQPEQPKVDQPAQRATEQLSEQATAKNSEQATAKTTEKTVETKAKKGDNSSNKSLDRIHDLAKNSSNDNASAAGESATSASMAGLVFKVQVCATQKNVDSPVIKSVYKLPDEVMIEMHEGWHKFTVGGYPQYSSARDKRVALAPYNLPGPFVTAYNNGTRITVQEALMISKQQWVK